MTQKKKSNIAKVNPVVSIKLDRERHLKFGLRAMRAIQEKTGKNPLEGTLWSEEKPDVNDFIIFLWAGLLHDDPDITIDQAISLADEHSNLPELIQTIYDAFARSMPESTEETERDGDDDPLSSTGSSGGPSEDTPSS